MDSSDITSLKNSSTDQALTLRRGLAMAILILAGEAAFLLPFVVVRIFRPTFLEVFGLNNVQIGFAFSLYGIIAMVSYFFGGPLADRYSARRLMSVAILLTAIGGISFASIPSIEIVFALYCFWGLTTILLFWAALIRATREWGGTQNQGKAYGLLDGGRGLVAALIASLAVVVFANLLPGDAALASLSEKKAALSSIIWLFSGIVLITAVLIWILIPDSKIVDHSSDEERSQFSLAGVQKVIRMPTIWLQAVIVICAYVAYKGTDDISLYVSDAFDFDDVAAARIATITFWIRPLAALGAGLLGDRIGLSKAVMISFVILFIGSVFIATGILEAEMYWMILFVISGTSVGIYALRGIYFALFQEAKIPMAYTGSAVGIVSVIGYTPDIFMGPLLGYLIDQSPGELGHQHVFAVVAGFALIGLMATLLFQKMATKRTNRIAANQA